MGLVRQASTTLGKGSFGVEGTKVSCSWTRLVALAKVVSWIAGSSLAALTIDGYLSTLESPTICNFSIVR